ncbi:MAG: lipid A biosynthesis (KDO)2-(lauroyl)-lipid IVA acyltransferase [Bacteroidales bacterium]|jgi:predicted LPLAT superfamily acyltransferase|nr:lipid A biosynthesis (KDO)2-(lauroyl)-lipid IVA acyltransferase [Bacteroidales bacterium]
MQTKSWTGITGGGNWGQKCLIVLFCFIHVAMGYAALIPIVPFYMFFARRRFLAIYRYFRKQWGFSPFKSFCKTYMNHFIFGQCMLDRFAVYAGKYRFFKIKFTGNDAFLHLLDKQKGFIIAGAHVGNFEISGYMLRQNKKRINALIFGGESEEIIKQRLKTFGRNNIALLTTFDDISHIFAINEAFSKGEIVCMTCDRNVGSAKSVTCNFLNGKVDFPQGAFVLATHFDVPIVTVFVMKETHTVYHVYVKILTCDAVNRQEKIKQLSTLYANELGKVVQLYPEQWFNFYEFWNRI